VADFNRDLRMMMPASIYQRAALAEMGSQVREVRHRAQASPRNWPHSVRLRLLWESHIPAHWMSCEEHHFTQTLFYVMYLMVHAVALSPQSGFSAETAVTYKTAWRRSVRFDDLLTNEDLLLERPTAR